MSPARGSRRIRNDAAGFNGLCPRSIELQVSGTDPPHQHPSYLHFPESQPHESCRAFERSD